MRMSIDCVYWLICYHDLNVADLLMKPLNLWWEYIDLMIWVVIDEIFCLDISQRWFEFVIEVFLVERNDFVFHEMWGFGEKNRVICSLESF